MVSPFTIVAQVNVRHFMSSANGCFPSLRTSVAFINLFISSGARTVNSQGSIAGSGPSKLLYTPWRIWSMVMEGVI